MPLLPSYPLDLTNSALSNRITDEIHTFNVLTDRMFVPSAGPFYTQGFDIRHPVTNAPLLPNVHYKILHLHKEASLQSGKNVCCIVYVHNAAIPGCKLNYQVVGGVYSDAADVIREILDNLPNLPNANQVHWGQIIGQPVQYPPAAHRHHVDSLYNMGDVVNVLEQIRTSMLAGDAGAFEAIYQYIFNLFANAAFVTGTQLNDEISARSSADTRINSIIQNTSKLNGYAVAAVLSKLLDQTLGESDGLIGDIVCDGLNVEIAAHATLIQYANYSDADGLSTSIPVIGVGLAEKSFETTAPGAALDEYNRYMLYARVVPRIDSPDTVYHPDTISDIDQYHSIGEIEYEFDGPYTAATVGDIVADQAARIGAGFVLIRSVQTMYGAIGTVEYSMVTKAVDKGFIPDRLTALETLVGDNIAQDRRALSVIVANSSTGVSYTARGFGAFGVVNTAAPGDCTLYVHAGTTLYNDDQMTSSDTPVVTAIQSQTESFTLARPVADWGQYLLFARAIDGDVEYAMKGPYLSAYPSANISSFFGTGYEFLTNTDFQNWKTAGGWNLMLGISVHATDTLSIRHIKQHGMSNILGDNILKTYASVSDLSNECDPRQLAFVRDINTLFKWDLGSLLAEDDGQSAPYIIVAPLAAYASTFMNSGRFVSIYRDAQWALFNNAISVNVGTNVLGSGIDLIDVTMQGRYYVSGSHPNLPDGFVRGILEVDVIDSLNRMLTLRSGNFDGRVWVKNRHNDEGLFGGDWGNWREHTDSLSVGGGLGPLTYYATAGTYQITLKPGQTIRVYLVGGGGGGGAYTGGVQTGGADTTFSIPGGTVIARALGGSPGSPGYGAEENIYPVGPVPARRGAVFDKNYVTWMSDIEINNDDTTPDTVLGFGLGGAPNPTIPSNWRYAVRGGHAGCIQFFYRNANTSSQVITLDIGAGGTAGDSGAQAGGNGTVGIVY